MRLMRIFSNLMSLEDRIYLEKYVAFCFRKGALQPRSVYFDPKRNEYLSIERYFAMQENTSGWVPDGITISIDGKVDDGGVAVLLIPHRRYKKIADPRDVEFMAQLRAAALVQGPIGRPVMIGEVGSRRPRRPENQMISSAGDRIAMMVGSRSVYDFGDSFEFTCLPPNCSPMDGWNAIQAKLHGRALLLVGDFFVRQFGLGWHPQKEWESSIFPGVGVLPDPKKSDATKKSTYQDIMRRSMGILPMGDRWCLPSKSRA